MGSVASRRRTPPPPLFIDPCVSGSGNEYQIAFGCAQIIISRGSHPESGAAPRPARARTNSACLNECLGSGTRNAGSFGQKPPQSAKNDDMMFADTP